MIKRKILLRAASALMLLHTSGHSFGAATWNKTTEEPVQKVIDAMYANSFLFMGRSVSLALFYDGYGISMFFVLLVLTLILWLLSLEPLSRLALRMQWLMVVFLFALSVTEYVYFFAFAAAISFLSSLLTAIACRYQTVQAPQ
jgi:hypothetical protein